MDPGPARTARGGQPHKPLPPRGQPEWQAGREGTAAPMRTSNALLLQNEYGPDKFVMEYQVEHERGFVFFGVMRFSANALLPLDPRRFTTRSNEPLGARLMDLEVPDESWVWVWSRWYVDMAANVDDQGWRYSSRFRSKSWSPRHRIFQSFVRQRQWLRPRVKRSVLRGSEPDSGAGSGAGAAAAAASTQRAAQADAQAGRDLIAYFASFRNDRERVDAIINYLIEHPDDLPLLVQNKKEIENLLTFDISRESLQNMLAESNNDTCQRFLLAPSSDWVDQVLLHGQPDEDIMDHDDEGPFNQAIDEENK